MVIHKIITCLFSLNGALFLSRNRQRGEYTEVPMKDVVDKCSTKGCAIDIGT